MLHDSGSVYIFISHNRWLYFTCITIILRRFGFHETHRNITSAPYSGFVFPPNIKK